MREEVLWGKVLFLMAFSLEIVASALAPIYIVWLFMAPFNLINSVAMMLAGIVGFASGTMVFWRFSVKFSRGRRDFKR